MRHRGLKCHFLGSRKTFGQSFKLGELTRYLGKVCVLGTAHVRSCADGTVWLSNYNEASGAGPERARRRRMVGAKAGESGGRRPQAGGGAFRPWPGLSTLF